MYAHIHIFVCATVYAQVLARLPTNHTELWYSYPYPCPEKLYKLHTVPICYLKMFYKLAWAWAWV